VSFSRVTSVDARLLRGGQSSLGLGHRLGVATAQPLALGPGQRLASFFDAAVGERHRTLAVADQLLQLGAAVAELGKLIGGGHALSLPPPQRSATHALRGGGTNHPDAEARLEYK
jgi:hypothetical protein